VVAGASKPSGRRGAANQRGQIGCGHAGKPLHRPRAVVWLPPVTGVAPADRRCIVARGIGHNGQRESGRLATAVQRVFEFSFG